MLRYQEQQQLQSKDVDKPASTSDMRMDQGRQGGAPDAFPTGFVGDGINLPILSDSPNPECRVAFLSFHFISAPPPQPGPGISVTRTFKVGDKVMFR